MGIMAGHVVSGWCHGAGVGTCLNMAFVMRTVGSFPEDITDFLMYAQLGLQLTRKEESRVARGTVARAGRS